MRHLFDNNTLDINLLKTDNGFTLMFEADYSKSSRKSQLYVNEKSLANDIETTWKSIKTKKLISCHMYFSEIDYYDNMTDIYQLPSFRIQRGLKKSKITYYSHGSIPKEWAITLEVFISDTKTVSPIMEVIKAVLGSTFTSAHEKEFLKEWRKLLSGKQRNFHTFLGEDN